MKVHALAWSGCKWLTSAVCTLLVWTLWLGLALLLALQVYVASSKQLEVPRFLRHSLEDRLALSGMRATFGRTIFDPSGRVLMEKVSLRLPGFEEPIATARAVYVRLDPWSLLEGRFEPAELRVTGVNLRVPAMLSPSGGADEVVHDLDGAFLPGKNQLGVEYLNFRLGGMAISVHGALHLPAAQGGASAPLPIAEFLAHNYATFSRELADALESLSVLDQPVVQVELTPAETLGATAHVQLFAQGLRLAGPLELRATALRVSGRVPFAANTGAPLAAQLAFAADEMDLPGGVVAHHVQARVGVRLPPGRLRFDRDAFTRIDLTAADVVGEGLTFQAPMISLAAGPLPKLRVSILTRLFDAPLAVQSEADLQAKTARVQFDAALAPGLLGPVNARLGHDIRKYVDFSSPIAVAGEARWTAGWKFQRVAGRVALRNATVLHVKIGEAGGRIEYDGRHLVAPEAYARLGDDFARGRYERDMVTRDYRYLLDGGLRPLDISAWFPTQEWWHIFFGDFAFPRAPLAAKVDVQGNESNGRLAKVFVAVDGVGPVYRGVAFDRGRARLFIRPDFNDVLGFAVKSGAGSASGTFTRRYDLDAGAWRSLDFNLASTFDFASIANVMGPKGAALLEPFAFDRPPALQVAGHLDGPAAPEGPHEILHIVARSDGAFRYHDFPFTRIAFTADVRDDRIAVSRIDAGFAGGALTGQATASGRGAAQRLNFSAELKGASLGQGIAEVETFAAKREHAIPPALTNFVREKSNVRLDLAMAGDGRADDFLSYRGGGHAVIEGTSLGEVRMLGMLSELIRFTSLRFTSARADFKINGPQLAFSDVSVTGANSAIRAQGTYALDKRELNFTAKIFPLQESKSLPQALISTVLMPLSEIFEVRLTGSIEKPSWELEHGPSSFLRSLTPANSTPAPASSAPLPLH